MVAIGMLLTWAGYAVTIWGYCLVRGYDVTFMQVFGARWPSGGADAGGLIGPVLPIVKAA
jgi:hypothetical protein